MAKVTKNECITLQRMISEAQEAMVTWLANGAKEDGPHSSLWMRTRLRALKERLDVNFS